MIRTLFGDNRPAPAAPARSNPLVENEFLFSITRYALDERFLHRWQPIVGSVDAHIQRAIQAGLITPAPLAVCLERRFTADELKPLLKQYGAPVSGKKAVLAERLAGVLPAAEIRGALGATRYFVATPAGQARVDAFVRWKDAQRAQMIAETLALLESGDAAGAGWRVAAYEQQQLVPRGMGMDWSQGMDETSIKRAAWLMRQPFSDIPYAVPVRRKIAACIALGEYLGEGSEDAPKRILGITGGTFSCPALESFLRSPDCCGGFAAGHSADDPSHLALLYAHTRAFEASAAVKLAQLLAGRHGAGVQILGVGNDDCRSCKTRKLKYRWAEMDALPRLPRHWGCRCMYLAWIP